MRPKALPDFIRTHLAAAASGLLLTVAFPKADLSGVAFVALIPLFFALKGTLSTAIRFRLGFTTGLIHYMTLIYWVVPTMTTYGHLPLYLCIPVLFLFSAFLAVYVGGFAVLAPLEGKSTAFKLLTPPLAWTGMEYLRSFLFTGFPWELLGYSQYRSIRLIQLADIFGVYGVSFMIVLVNAALFTIWVSIGDRSSGETINKVGRAAGAGILAAAVISGAWFYGQMRVETTGRQVAAAPGRRIAVIQGNIDQAVKWNRTYQTYTIDKYHRLSNAAVKDHPTLVVWPETATPFYFLHNAGLTRKVITGIQETNIDFLLGSNSMDSRDGQYQYYNSAYLVTSKGTVAGRYDKVHLVPFGEYVPFKKWLPFIGKMVEHVGDFKPGRQGETLSWRHGKLGILICYEIIFPKLSRKAVQNGAAILINITNDAWYGRTSAPFQHFSMAVFRAVENKRSVVRSANTGISGFIAPTGRIVAATDLYVDDQMTRHVPMIGGSTIYTRIGDLFAGACLSLCVAMVIFRIMIRRCPWVRERLRSRQQ